MSNSKVNIFLTGGTGELTPSTACSDLLLLAHSSFDTGYVGGSVLARLLDLGRADRSNFHITALVRSAEKGEKLKSLGVDAIVLGSYTDKDLGFLTEAASQADVVFTIVRLEIYSCFIFWNSAN
jgi:hypothetical protein